MELHLIHRVGSYRRIDTKGNITTGVMLEKTRMIVSFAYKEDMTKQALTKIASFLKDFGRQTNQESVAFALDGMMYYINIKKNKK